MAKIIAVAGVDEQQSPSTGTLVAWALVALAVTLIVLGTLRAPKRSGS